MIDEDRVQEVFSETSLSFREAQVYFLRFESDNDLVLREIGDMLGISAGAVGTKVNRILRKYERCRKTVECLNLDGK